MMPTASPVTITHTIPLHQVARADLADAFGAPDGLRNDIIAGKVEAVSVALDTLLEIMLSVGPVAALDPEAGGEWELEDPDVGDLLSEATVATITLKLAAPADAATRILAWLVVKARNAEPGTADHASLALLALGWRA